MKTFIAIPCMDKIDTRFVECLINMQPVGAVSYNFLEGSLIYDSRNKLAAAAVKSKSDYVMWVESDMVFTDTLLIDMMESIKGRDFVTGLCCARRPPFNPCIWKTLRAGIEPGDTQIERFDTIPDRTFNIEGCGFACVLMRTEMLETVQNKYHTTFMPLPWCGEDLSFCVRARGCGYELHCDPRIEVGHIGTTVVPSETYTAFNRSGRKL